MAKSFIKTRLWHTAKRFITTRLAQVFTSEFCKISKNTFFTGHLQKTASVSPFLSLYSFLLSSYELLLPVAVFPKVINFSCQIFCLLCHWFLIYYIFKLKTLITLVLLIWGFLLLAASFDIIWNCMEYVINLDDIWRYLSKTFDIWVERYLTIFNDNLAIFDNRNVHTGTRKLSPKRYCQISPFIA